MDKSGMKNWEEGRTCFGEECVYRPLAVTRGVIFGCVRGWIEKLCKRLQQGAD